MFYTSIVKKKKKVSPVDLQLGPKTPPQTMPLPVTSKENKITKTVPNPGFQEAPNKIEFQRVSWQAMICGLIPTRGLFYTACK